jgi:hypothetical protein
VREVWLLGGVTSLGALAIVRSPHLYEGQLRKLAPTRQPTAWNRYYRFCHWICLLDGVRQQVFFSFGAWVLVNRFGLEVQDISLVMLAVTFVCIFTTPRLDRAVDHHGERRSRSSVRSTDLRKICAPQDLAASLAMGLTVAHATAVAVLVVAGFILDFAWYQVPFFIACGIAIIPFFVTLRLDPVKQRCPARIAADEAANR